MQPEQPTMPRQLPVSSRKRRDPGAHLRAGVCAGEAGDGEEVRGLGHAWRYLWRTERDAHRSLDCDVRNREDVGRPWPRRADAAGEEVPVERTRRNAVGADLQAHESSATRRLGRGDLNRRAGGSGTVEDKDLAVLCPFGEKREGCLRARVREVIARQWLVPSPALA